MVSLIFIISLFSILIFIISFLLLILDLISSPLPSSFSSFLKVEAYIIDFGLFLFMNT